MFLFNVVAHKILHPSAPAPDPLSNFTIVAHKLKSLPIPDLEKRIHVMSLQTDQIMPL